MNENGFSDPGRPLVDRVADDIDPEEPLLAAIPNGPLAEISALRDLIERRICFDDAIEARVDPVEIHRNSLPGHTKQARRIAAEDRGLFFITERRRRKNEIHGVFLPRDRVIATEHDLTRADLSCQMA